MAVEERHAKKIMYSVEFKRQAVALASQPGVNKAQIGCEMDIDPNMITRWLREVTAKGSRAFLGRSVARDEDMASLKRENNRLRKERFSLYKTTN